jgi:tetratricopeptide (TPR) repeat protein
MTTEQQNHENQAQNANNLPMMLDIAAGVLLAGGSVASLITQQVAAAAFPISLAVGLNMVSRRKMIADLQNAQNSAVQQLSELVYTLEGNVSADMGQLRQDVNNTLQESLQKQAESQQNDVNALNLRLDELNQAHSNLGLAHETLLQSHGTLEQSHLDLSLNHQQLNDFSQNMDAQLKKIEDMVGELRQIDNFTQSIRSNPNEAEVFYRRGLSHHNLGDKEEAIADYTEALKLDPTHAKAYHNRGILLSYVGKKQKAAEDVRLAAKYYFEQGDLDSYEQARLLSRELYAVRSNETEPDLVIPDKAELDTEEEAKVQAELPHIVSLGALFN